MRVAFFFSQIFLTKNYETYRGRNQSMKFLDHSHQKLEKLRQVDQSQLPLKAPHLLSRQEHQALHIPHLHSIVSLYLAQLGYAKHKCSSCGICIMRYWFEEGKIPLAEWELASGSWSADQLTESSLLCLEVLLYFSFGNPLIRNGFIAWPPQEPQRVDQRALLLVDYDHLKYLLPYCHWVNNNKFDHFYHQFFGTRLDLESWQRPEYKQHLSW